MTVLAYESFDLANENPLGHGAWTTSPGNVAMQIVSNVATPTDPTTNDDTSYYSARTWGNDQFSRARLTVNSTAGSGAGVALIVRQASGANTRYRFAADHAASNNVTLIKFVAGVVTTLTGWPVTKAWTDNDLWELDVQGTTLSIFLTPASTGVKAQVGSNTTDSSIASGSPGIGVSTTVTSASINDWEGGDFSADPAIASTRLARAMASTQRML